MQNSFLNFISLKVFVKKIEAKIDKHLKIFEKNLNENSSSASGIFDQKLAHKIE
jgi:hypothetical protein